MAVARDWLRARWRLEGVDPGIARQIRVLSVVTVGIALVGVPFVGQYLMLGVPLMSAAVGFTIVVSIISLIVLHRSHDVRRCSIAVSCVFLGLLLLSNWVSGGFYDPNFAWFYTLPVAGALFINVRAGWAFTGIVLLLALGFWLAPSFGVVVPNLIPPEMHAVQSLANRVSAILTIGIMLAVIDSQRSFNEGLLHEAHEQTRAEMERRVGMQAQLAQADRMASMGRLSAGLAHEINNPLSYVMGNLELVGLTLAELDNDAEWAVDARELITDAVDGTQRIAELVKSLRDFAIARVDEAQVIEIDAALDWSLKMLAGQIRQRAQLSQTRTPGMRVRGHHGRLAQVFVNIIKNACQALPPGEAGRNRIEIRSARVGDEAVIEISDTGPGMDAATQVRLFEPFYSTKSQGEGMGLGLAICHGIVSAMQGQLSLDSCVGKGSTFTIRLPLCTDAPAVVDAGPGPELGLGLGLEAPLPRLKIVLIDDEPLILRALEGLLHEHDVRAYSSAQEALAELSGAEADVVLCDVMMPELNGMQVYERLAQQHPQLLGQVLFMTGGVLLPEVRAFLACVERPALEKPINGARLREALRELIERREPQGEQ